MKLLSYFLCLCCCLILTAPKVLRAQEQGAVSFATVGDNTSIPHGVITALYQDKAGFLWIGTQRGLLRYDGHRFKKYENTSADPNSIAGNFIRVIHQHHDGKLWIGTTTGLSVYNPNKDSFNNFYASVGEHRIAHNQVLSIVSDPSDGLWFGTSAGLNYLAKGEKQFSLFKDGLIDPQINRLLFDEKHQLWIGSRKGLFTFNKETHTFTPKFDSTQNDSLVNKSIESLFLAKDKQLWVGTKHFGSAHINQTRTKLFFHDDPKAFDKHHWVSSITQPIDEQIWVSSFGGGIRVYDAKSGEFIEQMRHDISIDSSLNIDTVSSLLVDDSGLLWVGTWGGGLNKVNVLQQAFRTLRHSPNKANLLTDGDVRSLIELHNGLLLFGTSSGGIDLFSADFKRIGRITHTTDNQSIGVISALTQSEDGTIWAGSVLKGLFKITQSDNEFTANFVTHTPAIKKLLSHNESIWIGSQIGLLRFNQNNNQLTRYQAPNGSDFSERINALIIDEKERLWIGSNNGLYLKHPDSDDLVAFFADKTASSLPSNQVFGLLIDSKKQLWVDTGKGLSLLKQDADGAISFEHVGEHFGDPDLYMGANLLEDTKGRIWTQWYVLEPEQWRITQLVAADGIDIGTAWVNSFFKMKDERLLYGGTEGVLIINPDKFSQWQYEPKLMISEFTLDGEPFPLTDNISLPSDNRGFSLEFSSSDFSMPQRNQFAYQLEGYDDAWHYTDADNRRVSYMNLTPGTYALKLKVSNRLGQWTSNHKQFTLNVLPKWYETLFFKIALALTILLLSYGFYLWRVNALKRQKIDLKQIVQQQTNKLEAANNTLMTISEVGRQIASTLDLNQVLEQLYAQTNELMSVDVFGIGIFRQDTGNIEFELAVERGKRFAPYIRNISDKEQLAVWVIDNKSPILIKEAKTELFQYISTVDSQEPKNGFKLSDGESSIKPNAYIYVPMIIKDKVIGVITVQSYEENTYGHGELNILQSIASYAAIAIYNAEKVYQLDSANRQLTRAKEALQDSNLRLEQMTLTDQLTGLNNRRFLMLNIDMDLHQTRREYQNWHQNPSAPPPHNSDLIFFIIDLDHFKLVNDNYGHSAGDKVLVEFAKILKHLFRESDYLIRWGGEEFLAVARFTQQSQAEVLAKRIQDHVARHNFYIDETRSISMTCSIGFACYPMLPHTYLNLTWEHIIDIADNCLYAAKKTSRNAWLGVYGTDELKDESFIKQLASDPEKTLTSEQFKMVTSIAPTQPIKWQ